MKSLNVIVCVTLFLHILETQRMDYLAHHELAELAIIHSDNLFLPKVGSINSDFG